MRKAALAIAALVMACSVVVTTQAEAKCGSKGGPGYRKADGRCASWKD